jgi:hypothetical protein
MGFYTDASGGTAGWSYFIKSNGRTAVYCTANVSQPNYDGTGAALVTTNTTNMYSMHIRQGNITSYFNGSVDANVNTGDTLRTNLGTGVFTVGSDPRFNRYTQQQIGEVIIITGVNMTLAEIQRIQGYQAHLFGLTSSLPADHPHKTTPPPA